MALPLAPGVYALDQMHTQIGFVVSHLGLTPIRGMFTSFGGQLTVAEDVDRTALEVSVDLLSLQMSHAGREAHVQGEDFFDSANHPTMSFRSSRIEGEGDAWSFEGPLTLRGVTQPVALVASLTGRTVFPMDGKEHIGFVANGSLSRTAFGVAPKIPTMMLSDAIQVELAVQLVAP